MFALFVIISTTSALDVATTFLFQEHQVLQGTFPLLVCYIVPHLGGHDSLIMQLVQFLYNSDGSCFTTYL
jgi:hypothetical protein